jgi:hypothetical protein
VDASRRSQSALRQWLVIGPFPPGGARGPASAVDPNASYDGLAGPVKWHRWERTGADTAVPVAELIGHAGPPVATACASVFVYSRRAATEPLWVSATGAAVCSINGRECLRAAAGTEATAVVRLEHGWNRILLELTGLDLRFSAGLDRPEYREREHYFVYATLFGKGPDDPVQAIETGSPATEWRRSEPDVVVYLPREGDRRDGDNEHFLVVPAPSGRGLIAMWTRSTTEAFGDNHLVLSRSADGTSWSAPEHIVGCRTDSDHLQASWGFPMISRGGRLYCFYQKSLRGTPGGGASSVMAGLQSDDEGASWREGPDIQVPTERLDRRDSGSPRAGFIVWQNAIRDRAGRPLAGYSGAGLGFMRFDNLDDGPDIADLRITFLPASGELVNLPRWVDRSHHCGEPSVVLLPDGRLFSTMRTTTGYVWYTVSGDDGESWSEPEVLRYRDGGEKVRHPLAPCPIYPLGDGRFLLLYHNNDEWAGRVARGAEIPAGMGIFTHRRPAFVAVGEHRPGAHQPLWFSPPRRILDNAGVIVSAKTSDEIATYTSFTVWAGRRTLWYPDRKYYLLGKHITDETLRGLEAP